MTKWAIEFTPKANKQLKDLDHKTQQKIATYLDKVLELENPKLTGKGLVGQFKGQ